MNVRYLPVCCSSPPLCYLGEQKPLLSSPQQRQKTTGNASPKDFPSSSLQPTPIIPLNREGEEGIWIVAINYGGETRRRSEWVLIFWGDENRGRKKMDSPKTLVGSINKIQIIGPPTELPRPA